MKKLSELFKKSEKNEQKSNHKAEVSEKAKSLSDDEYVYLDHIYKIYQNGIEAVHDFDLKIKKHEFIVLVGPSGCGKSTTLRMIAGLEDISIGDLYIDKEYSNYLSPKDRNIALVFQSYALYPHMSVYDNIAFGLKMRKVKKDEIDKRVKQAAEILELQDYLNRKPKELSGGQRQRVALGRAIVRDAKLFLMDEPLSNLDAKLRVQMRSEIVKLHKRMNATTIYVTHDQTEAMTMGDRIVVMKDGLIQQIGTPSEIYNHPKNVFVSQFIGSPATNIVEGTYFNNEITFADGNTFKLTPEMQNALNKYYSNYEIDFDEYESKLKNRIKLEEEKKKLKDEKLIKKIEKSIERIPLLKENYDLIKSNQAFKIYFGIRPEDIHHHVDNNKEYEKSKVYKLNINFSELLGNEFYIHLDFAGKDFIAKIPAGNRKYMPQEEFNVHFDLGKVHLFDFIKKETI